MESSGDGDESLLFFSTHPTSPTAPSHHFQPPLSMHQNGWLQTDKCYTYIINIYEYRNFNGLLVDFPLLFFNLFYRFILVMRNNILFCVSFSSFLILLLFLLLLRAVWYLWTHTQTNTHIQQTKASNMSCSFWWGWCMIFFWFFLWNVLIFIHTWAKPYCLGRPGGRGGTDVPPVKEQGLCISVLMGSSQLRHFFFCAQKDRVATSCDHSHTRKLFY